MSHLHGVEGEVAGDLELLEEDLLPYAVDADKLGLAPCQERLPIRRIAQGVKGPTRTQATALHE